MTPVNNTLKRDALKLRLSGLLGSLELRLREADPPFLNSCPHGRLLLRYSV